MAQSRKQHFPRWLVLIIAIGFVIGSIWALIGPIITQDKWYPPGFVAAKQLWNARSFSRYRMVYEYTDANGKALCEQDVEIQDEFIIRRLRNTGGSSLPFLTVAEMFEQIEHDANNIRWINGPGCDALLVYATYNPQFGFPEQIEYKHESPNQGNRANWPPLAILEYEFHSRTLQPCTLLGVRRGGYVIRSLTPLPESAIF